MRRRVDDHPGLDQRVGMPAVLAPARKRLGQPGSRHCVEHEHAKRHQTRPLALPERRAARQRQHVRQEIRQLVHQVDAQLVVVDADVDVQAADHHAPRRALHLLEKRDVALLVRALLAGGEREGMRRRRDGRQTEAAGDLDHRPAQLRELLPRLADVAADRCRDLHLGTQELGEGTSRRLGVRTP